MAIDNAEYVKLPERLWGGTVVDVDGSHWGIAGLDVKEVPEDDPDAEAFVRTQLRLGNLEEASAAEFNSVQFEHDRLAKAGEPSLNTEVGKGAPWNEPHIANVSRTGRNKLLKQRFAAAAGAEDDSDQYEHLTKPELVGLLERRSLATTGRARDMKDRLREDDSKSRSNSGAKAASK